jgi:hypothetical protein
LRFSKMNEMGWGEVNERGRERERERASERERERVNLEKGIRFGNSCKGMRVGRLGQCNVT